MNGHLDGPKSGAAVRKPNQVDSNTGWEVAPMQGRLKPNVEARERSKEGNNKDIRMGVCAGRNIQQVARNRQTESELHGDRLTKIELRDMGPSLLFTTVYLVPVTITH